MTSLPWSKFYWDDWESDEALKMCSPGAQALWMRMLCVCAKADGYLAIAGRKLDVEDMCRLTGWPALDVRAWWDELKRWGVFSVEGRGRVYCRRMIKDARKAAIARENGKNGGNPKLRKTTTITTSDIQTETDGSTDAPGISQKPEARSQILSFPEPHRENQPQQNGATVRRGTRLPRDWLPDPGEATYATQHGIADPLRLAEDFRDYWTAKPGQAGVKLDWPATWRRWVRTEATRRPQKPKQKQVDWC